MNVPAVQLRNLSLTFREMQNFDTASGILHFLKTTEGRERGIRKTFAEMIALALGWLGRIETFLNSVFPTNASIKKGRKNRP